MIYPQKLNSKKSNLLVRFGVLLSILVALILLLLNRYFKPRVPWAAIANGGIIYVWIVLFYSIKKNINIAGHVLLQTLALSALTVFIDYQLGFKAWSLDIIIPVLIVIANVTMFVLTIISYKNFIKYAMYQLVISLFSILPIVLYIENITHNKIMCIIASIISGINLALSLILCTRDLKETVVRKFHM